MEEKKINGILACIVISVLMLIMFFTGFLARKATETDSDKIESTIKAYKEGRIKYKIVTTEKCGNIVFVDTINYEIIEKR